MTEENKEKNKQPWMDTIKYEFDSDRRKAQIYEETLKWLETDEKVQNYLKGFQSPPNIAQALSSYAWQKARWLVYKDRNEWMTEVETLKYKNEAEECLGNIQQKKLFDKQCQWRAEQFTHPAIETTHDFMHWEFNILNCPFLDPITQEDIDLYIEFLQTYLGENLAFLGSWQDYNTYNTDRPSVTRMVNIPPKEDEDDENEEDNFDGEFEDENEIEEGDESLMPPWYVFCNEKRGEGHYLLLPDLRQEKEWFYSRMAAKEQEAIWKEKFKTDPPDTRPFLTLFGRKNLEPFINRFEKDAKEIMKAYEVYEKLYNDPEEEGMYWVNEAWEELRDCYESFPLAQGITDWKEALIATAKQWKNTKIIRMLPVVYEEYLFRMQTGIEHPYDTEQAAHYRKTADNFKEAILRGKELNGEPRDLNF